MPISVTVDVTGATPVYVYLCDTGSPIQCIYITGTTSLPYTFNVPAPFQNLGSYNVKVIDNNGCEIIQSFTV